MTHTPSNSHSSPLGGTEGGLTWTRGGLTWTKGGLTLAVASFLTEWNDTRDTILVHTSGSTGKPKPMHVEKRRMLASARITCDFLNLQPGDTALLCMPLDYIAGKMMVVRSIERQLRLITVNPSNHPLHDLPTDTPAIHFAAMVPSQVYCSLQVPEEREMLMAIQHLIIGGGAIPQELERELRLFPNAVWSTYGMTETLSHIALRRLNGKDASEWYEPFDSVKVSLNSNDCLVIDAPLVHEGTLTTNDIAELNDDGRRFRIIGRRDNVICSGGIKLQIEQIEDKIRTVLHEPFCITKRSDEKFGEVAILLATQHRDDRNTLFAKVLTRYEMPKDVIITPAIPLTGTGKIDRKAASDIAINKNAKSKR